MRVNSRVFTEKTDLLGGIQIPTCPSQFRGVAERLIMMATKLGYSVPDYHNMTQLDKILTLHFWREYDGLDSSLFTAFDKWYICKATNPDLITRAIRWLISRNYLLIKPEVAERAYQAEDSMRRTIGSKK